MIERIPSTTTQEAAAEVGWDIVVIGAGPAGAVAAREAARRGGTVLLVDRASFPRAKVCGCCLNGAALGILAEIGLEDLTVRCGAVPLARICLASRRRRAIIPLGEGVSLSRKRFDAELIQAAIAAGAQFLDGTQATIGDVDGPCRIVELKADQRVTHARPAVVVVAGGLGCRVFAGAGEGERQTAATSRVGAGAVLDTPSSDYSPGTIYMLCHRDGYVGLVRLEDGQLDIAAALDATAIKRQGGIGPLIERILETSEMPLPAAIGEATWHGTARLTQSREHVGGPNYFVVGDAAGYIEPFTGEGIAWALATGRAVAPFALDYVEGHVTDALVEWSAHRSALIGERMRRCRIVSHLLRHPTVVSMAVRLLARAPGLATPFVNALNRSFATKNSSNKSQAANDKQIPNDKHQITNKHQNTSTKSQTNSKY